MAVQVLASVNGDSATVGPRTASAGDTIQLSLADYDHPVIAKVLWEIYSFPPDYPLPSGWTANTAGDTYYCLTVGSALPPNFDVADAPGWGKYLPRATANDGRTDGLADPTLIDETSGVEVVGPLGIHDVATHETNQFDETRQWTGAIQDDLRILGTALASGGVTHVNSLTGDVTIAAGTNVTLVASGHTLTLSAASFSVAGQTAGDIAYFNGTTWVRLGLGTFGYYLQAGGTSAPTWQPFALTDTGISSAAGIQTSKLAHGSAGQLLWSNSGTLAASWFTPTAAGDGIKLTSDGATFKVDLFFTGQAQGDIVYRDASAWGHLAAGTAGFVLASGGPGANPSWVQRTQPQSTTPAAVASAGATGTGTTYARDDHAHAGVATINTLQGDVTIAVSGNLSLTPSGNTLTLSSTGVTGTGFVHYTTGTRDSAAKLVVDADVDAAAAIAVTKIANGTTGQVLASGATQPAWVTPTATDGLSLSVSGSNLNAAVFVANQANGSIYARSGGAWTSILPGTLGQALNAQGSGTLPAYGAPGEIVSKIYNAIATSGNTDDTIHTTPGSPIKEVITGVYFIVTGALVGSGSVTVTVGITAGGVEMLKSCVLTSADAALAKVFGLSIGTEAGTSMLQDNGSAYDIPVSTPIVVRFAAAGTVTTAPTVKVWVNGLVFKTN